MWVVGLSGGIASGKSSVAKLFEQHGVPVVDADICAREVVEPGSEALSLIRQQVCAHCFLDDGQLDRAALRQLIFHDPEAKQRLESILHPRIRQRAQAQLAAHAAAGHLYALHAIPLLLESGQQHHMDRILMVDCDRETQIARVMARDGSDRTLAEKILQQQASRAARLAIADDVIDNGAGRPLSALQEQVAALHQCYSEWAQAARSQSESHS